MVDSDENQSGLLPGAVANGNVILIIPKKPLLLVGLLRLLRYIECDDCKAVLTQPKTGTL